MNDTDITQMWTRLEPNERQRARIDNRVFEWIEASETSLLAEWLNLIKVDPLPGLGFAAMAAASLLMLTPLGWVAASMLR
jgi:hypothetical protein